MDLPKVILHIRLVRGHGHPTIRDDFLAMVSHIPHLQSMMSCSHARLAASSSYFTSSRMSQSISNDAVGCRMSEVKGIIIFYGMIIIAFLYTSTRSGNVKIEPLVGVVDVCCVWGVLCVVLLWFRRSCAGEGYDV